MNEPSSPQEVKEDSAQPNTRAALAHIVSNTPSCIRLSDIQDGRRHVIWLVAAVVLALAGATLSAMLYAKGSPLFGQDVKGFAAAFCGDAGSACDQVADSKWGGIRFKPGPNVEMRIPTSLIGLVYFAFLFVWFLFVGRANHPGRRWHVVPVLLTTVGAAVSGYLTYIMVSVIQITCPLCLAIHIINGVLFIVTLVLWPGRGETEVAPVQPPSVPSGRLVVTTLVLSLAMIGNVLLGTSSWWNKRQAGYFYQLYGKYTKDGELMAYMWKKSPEVDIPVTDADAVLGPADAEHTIVIFSDFHCSVCSTAETLLRDKVMTLPGVSVRLVNKYLPQDTACDAHRDHTHFKGACETAYTAEAVLQTEGEAAYWKAAEALFNHQAELGPALRRKVAEDAGLTDTQYKAAVVSATVRDRVKACTELAHELGVTATPTIFLDGRRVEAWQELSTWEAIFGVKAKPTQSTPDTQPAAETQPDDDDS